MRPTFRTGRFSFSTPTVGPRLRVRRRPAESTHVSATTPIIAYVTARFPSISETFVLYEMLEIERLGARVELFPLVRQRLSVQHVDGDELVERAHFASPISWQVLTAQLYWLTRRPLAYVRAWWRALRGNLRSPRFLSRAIVATPQAAAFARVMEREGVQHIHAHWAHHATLAAYVAHQLTSIPFSFTGHANDIFVDQTMLAEKIRSASFMVTISDFNWHFLRDLYGDELASKIHVVRCGVDSEAFRPREPDGTTSPVDERAPFDIVCVGRLHEKKGHVYLVDAVARLRERGVSLRCHLVGEGDQRPRLEARIRELDLEDEVEVLGRQPQDRVIDLLATADVMVLPSVHTPSGRKEGIPVALMEAMASGLPVVATDLSGIPELVEPEKTGLLVPERDPAALADAIQRLVDDPGLRRRLATAGRAKVAREFDRHRNVRRLYDLMWNRPEASRALGGQPLRST